MLQEATHVPVPDQYVMLSSAVSASDAASYMSATSTVLIAATVLDCQAYQVSCSLCLMQAILTSASPGPLYMQMFCSVHHTSCD